MIRRVYLVRHAVAEDRDAHRWPDDADRPLSEAGARKFRRIAPALVAAGTPDVVLSSAYARAWQTAQLLEEHGWPSPQPFDALANDDLEAVIAALPAARSVALVGHAPYIGRLASLLLTSDADRLTLEMKKGAVLCLDLDSGPGDARLRWYAPPRLLR